MNRTARIIRAIIPEYRRTGESAVGPTTRPDAVDLSEPVVWFVVTGAWLAGSKDFKTVDSEGFAARTKTEKPGVVDV